MAREQLHLERMRRQISRAMVIRTGTREQLVLEYAEAAIAWMVENSDDSGHVCVPNATRVERERAIERAIQCGHPLRQICRQFGISRASLYRNFDAAMRVRNTLEGEQIAQQNQGV